MLLLTSTSDLIKVVTDSAATVDVHAHWVDRLSGADTPDRTLTAISSATTTDVVGSPGSSTTRNVRNLMIRNKDTALSVYVRVQHYDGTRTVDLDKQLLFPGQSMRLGDQSPESLVTYGLFASMPAGRAGARHYASDSGIGEWIHDGTEWRPCLLGQQLGYRPPLAANFSYLTGGTNNDSSTAQTHTPTVTDSAGRVLVSLANFQSKLHPLLLTGHCSDVVARLVPAHNAASGSPSYAECQLVIRENATGKMAVNTLVIHGGNAAGGPDAATGMSGQWLVSAKWSNVGTRAATPLDFPLPLGHGPLFLRVRASGTSAIFSYSYCPNDASGWVDFDTITSTFTTAPNSGSNPYQAGVSIETEVAACPAAFWIESLKRN